MKRTYELKIKEIPVPKGTIMVSFEPNTHEVTHREMFFEASEFLEFWKPLVEYYEGIKNDTTK